MSSESEDNTYEWSEFDLNPVLFESLEKAGFENPTEVQAQSLKHVKFHSDLIISARTGEGKTLCFLLPILNNLIDKFQKQLEKNGLTLDSDVSKVKDIQKEIFNETRALILTPTRELAIQIKEHLHKIIPDDYKKFLTSCELIGGMSLQKQERKLGYRPTILIGTPGRVWELIDDSNNEYLTSSLPKNLEVLVLDEADRMVEIGHFKEMNFILDFIYIKREELELRKNETEEEKEAKQTVMKSSDILNIKSKFKMGKNLETSQNSAEIQAMIDQAEDLGEELGEFDEEELVIDDEQLNNIEEEMTNGKKKKKSNHKEMRVGKKEKKGAKSEKFVQKSQGIQTIVCSATLTLDAKGRIRPTKKGKKNKRLEDFDALEEICKKLRFKQKKPKVINLTNETKMPSRLVEKYHRCTNDDKDLYTYYFLQNHMGESTIIFVNSITCIKRLSSMMNILQITHRCLHSKMQQRARLKHLDRFKRDVEQLKVYEEEQKKDKTAVLVCTDVAARGLDIPNVDNVIHYQMPMNAEVYVHRSGRTARMGSKGLTFSLFAPEDEKKFKLIYTVLKGKESLVNFDKYITPLKINLVELERYKEFVNTAKDLEKAMFDKKKNSIRANWLLKVSEETGIPITDDLKKEVAGLAEMENLKTRREQKLEEEQNIKKKRVKKEEDKKIGVLKKNFHNMKQYKNLAHVSSKSSFLNPTNVKYLNEALFGNGKLNNHLLNKTILKIRKRQRKGRRGRSKGEMERGRGHLPKNNKYFNISSC
ncbi:unnamed protein product [Moneuplotes crassus]|uniref:ATP-dependent RNA helicase n=1 Tax=Euplotes crassus TaxID=5936 RepID=A0AAD2DC99_EUPCR|nr:unnamed protein product [Moneuplotes crassus]